MAEEQPIPGWMRVLGALLLIVEPLRTMFAAVLVLQSLYVRGLPAVLILLLKIAVAGLSMSAASAIFGRRSHALTLAAVALAAAAATDVFVYLTPFFPNNRAPGDTPFYVAGTLVYHGGWLAYVLRTRRQWSG
jgi:hypothetical protein